MSESNKEKIKSFRDFVAAVSSKELGLIILDAKYTSDFNFRMKNLIKEIGNEGNADIELSILFNTNGEIAVIDEYLIGNYISNIYQVELCKYYKIDNLDTLVKKVSSSTAKGKEDFVKISYFILYKTMEEIFEWIKYKAQTMKYYNEYFGIEKYKNDDKTIIILIFMILYDITKHLKLEESYLKKLSSSVIDN
ncbi:hypothetical protein SH2C18_08250 [Clostridium sediminicola]|uniref:hypothetical protein n=1 Tax=Clostridium sediminicola TaxID=3114879 RepID=UPI0031F21713